MPSSRPTAAAPEPLATPHNAKDPYEAGRNQILIIGGIGVGKTTLFRTLPGRKFMYVFDPNSVDALRGSDIEFLEFIPDITDLDLSAKTLKDPLKQKVQDRTTLKKVEPRTYINWERDFETRHSTGLFADYDWVGFDSFTTFSEIVMDRIQYLNGRLNKHPEQADYTAQMAVTKNVFRVATATSSIYCTAHTETFKDEFSGRVHGKIMMTGRNRIRIPLMFSHIFALHPDHSADGKMAFELKTVPDREDPVVRTSIREMAAVEDVTVDWTKPLEGQGLGRWF